jgi:DnaJ-domain-containing protein 1
VPDYFAVFQECRRPWLDPADLKDKFIALSSSAHPDRVHGASEEEKVFANQRFTEINAAYQCLRDPKERLRHLLELETGGKPAQVHQVPATVADLFIEISNLCRSVDVFLNEKNQQTSPLLKAMIFERGLEWTDRLQELQGEVNRQRDALLERLKSLDQAWTGLDEPPSPDRVQNLPLAELEEVYRMLSYLKRWSAQLENRATRCTM